MAFDAVKNLVFLLEQKRVDEQLWSSPSDACWYIQSKWRRQHEDPSREDERSR